MTRNAPFWFLPLGLLLAVQGLCEEPFPRPAELEPDVAFWVRVFSAVDSDSGLLHDNRNLAIVYREIVVPADLPARTRQKQVDAEKEQVRTVLETLASGKREGLSAEESAILELWGRDASDATFREAATRIRFQRGLADRFRAGLKRAGRWRAYIENEFRDIGIPVALAALPHVESSYNPAARSHVGASGIWQFTRSTGRRFLRIDHVLDERNDPFAASRAAGQLLAYNYSITGNWPTAITAYNHGLAGVRRAMEKYGDTAYVDILRRYDGRTFGFASRNFYVAFLAAAQIDQDPQRYFPGLEPDAPDDYELVELSGYIGIPALERYLGVDADTLRASNGALQPTIWQGSKLVPRDYLLRLPAGVLEAPVNELLARIPASDWVDEQLPDLFHTIAPGDTLSEIAEHYGTSVATLVALNNLGSRNRIRAGQQLRLPAAGPAPAASEAVEAAVVAAVAATPTPDEALAEAMPAAMSEEPAAAAETGEPVAEERTGLLSDPSDYSVADDGTIEVQALETLGHYADWLGIRTQRLRDINGLAFGAPVTVGERLRLEFDAVDADAFESRRVAWHRAEQDRYFREHVITGVRTHVIQRGESVWVLSLREYQVPLWLFRQYNPGFDLTRVRPGDTVQFPVLEAADRS